MGKKNKKEKKGQGKEKTIQKMEKKANKRMKKELAEKGEEDIEKMIAEFQQQDRRSLEVIEEKCPPPSQRSNMSLSPHPDREELIMFGGEYCTGNKMFMYNDLLFYNIKKNEWLKITAPNAPPPRSSHQAVTLKQGGGQLWIFGGEFASPTQSQFYHYKDLWLLHLKEKKWEKIVAPGGPSARSGHRMVECKKRLIVFGGFHDNVRDYKYYNDVYMFDLETYQWSQVTPQGIPPAPRSGCVMAALPDLGRILVYGGYSKERIKKEVDQGKVHTDMFILAPEGKAQTGDKWKWMNVKQSGSRPSQRSGISVATLPGNRLICFGGVVDEEENEEEIKSKFYNNMYIIEAEKGKWFDVELRGKRENKERKRRRRKEGQENEENEEGDEEDNSDTEEMEVSEDNIKRLTLAEDPACMEGQTGETMDTPGVSTDTAVMETEGSGGDGVFRVTLGPSGASGGDVSSVITGTREDVFMPPPRMNCMMAVKSSQLFLYGGLFESGDKQFTLSDFYSLDISKMDEWKILIESDLKSQVWEESESSSDGEMDMEGACAKDSGSDDDDDDDDDEDDDEDMDFSDAPERASSEPIKEYFTRTRDYWLGKASGYCEEEGMKLSDNKLEKLAREMCQEAFGSG